MDNLANFGIKDDAPQGSTRIKPRGKQSKPFAIECMLTTNFIGSKGWWVYSRYTTAGRRDEAFASLVKKAKNSPFWKPQYRKRND